MASIWDQAMGGGSSPFGSNIFWQPGSTYGADQSYYTSPVSGIIREQNPSLAFSSFLNRAGIGDNDTTFNRWVYNQFPRFERAYGQATLENPYITIDQFLATMPTMAGLQAQFQRLAPQQRGISFGRTAPVSRWITR